MRRPTDPLDHAVAQLREIDWEDIDEVEQTCRAALDTLATDPVAIRHRLTDLPNRTELMALCEHYDILDKIVLFDDRESGVRVRLHVFLPGYFDRPHNHRWSYASRILRGHYRHYLFGNAELDEHINPNTLPVLHAREEPVGTSYALHHSVVHAVVAEPYTVSLVIRGPAVKDRFLVMDRNTSHTWWQTGVNRETAEEAQRKRMSAQRLQELIGQLNGWQLF